MQVLAAERNVADGTICWQMLFWIRSDSDCILHGYIKKLGGPFASAWQTRYARLYPNRLELHYESNSKPELVLMDHIEDINSELTTFKGEPSIFLRTKEGTRVVLTNQVILCLLFLLFFLPPPPLSALPAPCSLEIVYLFRDLQDVKWQFGVWQQSFLRYSFYFTRQELPEDEGEGEGGGKESRIIWWKSLFRDSRTRLGFFFNSSWIPIGILSGSCWAPAGFPVGFRWNGISEIPVDSFKRWSESMHILEMHSDAFRDSWWFLGIPPLLPPSLCYQWNINDLFLSLSLSLSRWIGDGIQDEIGLKEWLLSLRTAHKNSLELLANMARKAGKIYGTDRESNNRQQSFQNSPVASRSANGN